MASADGVEPRAPRIETLTLIARRAGAAAIDQGLNWLSPPQCLICAAPTAAPGALCGDCWRETPFIAGPVCDRCGAPFEGESDGDISGRALCDTCATRPAAWDRGRAATLYEGPARALTLALKWGDRTDAARPMGRWMARAGAALVEETDLVTPTPLHWRRRAARRFNQSAELAREVAALWGKPLDLGALRRRRATVSQQGKTLRERRRNVDDAFAVAPSAAARLAGRRVLLVDDVLTTGATASACAATLFAAGARNVHLLVFSRVRVGDDDPTSP